MKRCALLTAPYAARGVPRVVRGELLDAPDIEDGVRAMQVLEMMMRSMLYQWP